MWFIVKHLPKAFGETQKEIRSERKLLLEAEEALNVLSQRGAITQENRDIFLTNLYWELITLDPDEPTLSRAADTLLALEKRRNDLDSAEGRLTLFGTYYRIVHATQKGGSQSLLVKATELGEEGLALLDDQAIGLAQKTANPTIGWYYGALGQVHLHLGNNDKALELFEHDAEHRMANYKYDPSPFALLSLAGGYHNLARAYGRIGKFREAHEVSRNAIQCYEEAVVQQGQAVQDAKFSGLADLCKRMYYESSQFFFLAHDNRDTASFADLELAIRWAYKGCGCYRELYRKNGDDNSFTYLQRSLYWLQNIQVPTPLHGEILTTLGKWIQEGEDELALDNSVYNAFIFEITCLVSARVVVSSKIEEGYASVLERCKKAAAIAESTGFEGVEGFRNLASLLYKEICAIECTLCPNDENPLLDWVANEERLTRQSEESSEYLGDANRDLALFCVRHRERKECFKRLPKAAQDAAQAYDKAIGHYAAKSKDASTLIRKKHECLKLIEGADQALTVIGSGVIDYDSLIAKAVRLLGASRAPKLAKTVSPTILNNALASYAPTIDVDSIVAIDGAGFPSKGRRGVLYTKDGICSSELHSGTLIEFSQMKRISYFGDSLCFQMNDGSQLEVDFGAYQNTVYEMVSRILEMRETGAFHPLRY